MQAPKHSFSRSILCRRECDNCQKSIRFFGVKCRDCRYKCHKKCSTIVSSECELHHQKVNNGKRRPYRFWRKSFRKRRKCALDSGLPRSSKDCSLWTNTPDRQICRQRKNKPHRKFMSGLYESFCYTANHTIEFQPAEPERVSSLLSSDYTGTLDPCGFHAVPPDFTDSPPISFLSSSPYQPYGNSLHTSSSGFCGRTYSWSSRTSARTTTNSSGYCSVNNSCPSSANSHRSTSPTPDFSNIKLLSANLEKCSLDEEGILEESDISSSGTDGDFLCTWPPFAGVSIREDCAGEAGDGNARVFTGESSQLRNRDHLQAHSTLSPWPVIGNIPKQIEFDIKKSLREWNIPHSDLQFGDIVGVSPKGHVYRGRWHGEIMIHTRHRSTHDDLEEFLKEPNEDDKNDSVEARQNLDGSGKDQDKTSELQRSGTTVICREESNGERIEREIMREYKVSLLSMIRHENVVLFMGACLEPPNLAVVTSARKGLPLHTHLHIRQDLFALQSRINIAKQIAQGLGYLHAKGIVLSRLNSMNICLESKVKLCVTEYSSCCSQVEREGYASLPQGHLTYLAPELMRTLQMDGAEVTPSNNHSVKSNVYTYGTILFEVLTGKWPFALCPADSVIWMIGRGRRQCVRHLKCPEELKDLITECWREDEEDRPTFSHIVQLLQEQNVPPEANYRRHSFSEPEKMNLVGRKHCKLALR